MTPNERRQELIAVLYERRHDTYENLAFELQVSTRTICRDIAVLMCSYPLETVRGRYGGGVKIADGYYRDRKFLNREQTALLKNLRNQLSGSDLTIMNSILVQFAP